MFLGCVDSVWKDDKCNFLFHILCDDGDEEDLDEEEYEKSKELHKDAEKKNEEEIEEAENEKMNEKEIEEAELDWEKFEAEHATHIIEKLREDIKYLHGKILLCEVGRDGASWASPPPKFCHSSRT